jgi:hypothetical protein
LKLEEKRTIKTHAWKVVRHIWNSIYEILNQIPPMDPSRNLSLYNIHNQIGVEYSINSICEVASPILINKYQFSNNR